MGLFLLLCLAACGGRSVVQVDDSDAGPGGQAAPISTGDDCVSLCEGCGMDLGVGATDCEDFCASAKSQAALAECGALFDAFIDCRTKSSDACSYRTCPSQTNNLTVCVLSYCDLHSVSAPELCSTW